jgi:ribosomal protein S18 acetylase RimI-like enzyme
MKKITKANQHLLREVEAAAYLKMSYSKLRLYVRPQNKIAFHRFGSSIFYTVEDLKTYIARNRVEAVN